jgi:hypothetical protein
MKAAILLITLSIVSFFGVPDDACAKGAICLYDSTDIEVKKNLSAVVKVFKTFEITTEEGARFAEAVVPLNDYIKIKDIRGYTHLPGGRKIKLKSRDIQMASAARIREFGGTRLQLISLRSPSVGAIIHYQYTLNIKSLLYLPRITRDTSYPTGRFVVRLRWHKNVKLNYDSSGLEIEPSEKDIRFFARHLPELPVEKQSCPDELYLLLSSEVFIYDEMKFHSRSWADVGRFFARQALQSEESLIQAGRLASRLVRGSLSRQDTLRALFDFVADSVSYVALEIGKGDFDPNSCGLIIERRFGDCKDQSVLLSSLFRSVGIDAYPALIFTGDYPEVGDLHPWPAFFDHAVVVIKGDDGRLILDPSDPLSSIVSPPLRLRGKSFVAADGYSGLQELDPGPIPSLGILWQFTIMEEIYEGLSVDFSLEYLNDGAISVGERYGHNSQQQLYDQVATAFRDAGWRISSVDFQPIIKGSDSVVIAGRFLISDDNIHPSGNLAIGSPLIAYLLNNIFDDVRERDYCRNGSIYLEESVRIMLSPHISIDMDEYHDLWFRVGLEFSDDLSYEDSCVLFRRTFDFVGGMISVDDYNDFRDYILSTRNQRYVQVTKQP